MTDDDLRYLNDNHYYQWGEYKGELSIFSECCADGFSPDEEIELLRYLLAKHSQPDPLATLRAEVERLRDEASAEASNRAARSYTTMAAAWDARCSALSEVLGLIDKQREGR